ncbi:hypothetical protein PAEH1_03610 [Paenalcaligenes hominis]|uniref:Uncharacterized protein n=1 Tax=Paenalcaligenes hominis TaxID=643674 RepID=A0A1U9JYP5_9BURK|nr:hypothetical protein [Paenalcaligenes hominis]AQS50881.1 hypothetical protein PAEH1_03610 [Paenalcaligenes hominis]
MSYINLDCDIDKVVERIRLLKKKDFFVLLKTKNEVELLEDWIKHYGEIFGYESLIILDNYSDEPLVHDVYSKYIDRVGLIATFGDGDRGHNLIHYPESKESYLRFYEEIKKKCRYFGFFDTDEFLVFIDNQRVVTGEEVRRKILSWYGLNKGKILHCYWLNSIPGRSDRYALGSNFLKIFDGVKKGKYFVPSDIGCKYPSGHNSCAPTVYAPHEVSMNFWLLHRQSSSIERRIKVNYNKINSRGMFKGNVTLSDVLSNPHHDLLINSSNGICNSYMQQIINFCDNVVLSEQEDWVSFEDERLCFSSAKAESNFLKFIKNSNFKKWISSYFKSPYSCVMNKQPMIDIGVYGEAYNLGVEEVNGWVLDTASQEVPIIALKWNGEILFEFSPTLYKEIKQVVFSEATHFYLNDSLMRVLREKIKSCGGEGTLELIFRRTNKRLRNGMKIVTSVVN